MLCSAWTDSSMGMLESSSSLVLDAAFGELNPLSLLLCFTILCVQSSSLGSLFHFFVSQLLLSYFPSHSIVFAHGFCHSNSMPIRFHFHFCLFTFYNCSWSSWFSVIMNTRVVATCPPLNGASILHRFISLVTSWMSPSSIVAVKMDYKFLLEHNIFPCRFRFLQRGAILAIRSEPSRIDAIHMFCAVDLLDW